MRKPLGTVGAVAALAAAVGACWAIGIAHPVPDPTPRGDQLGMEDGETRDEYVARANASIGEDLAAAPAYALVSFQQPVAAEEAARVVEGVERVNAVVAKQHAPVAVPEPVAGATRADVFARAVGDDIAALVVRDSSEVLRAVAQNPGVLAVEALPPDAVWGAFGVREVR